MILETQSRLERNVTLLSIFTLIAVMIGGLVQMVPMFFLDNTIEKVEGMRPYTPLELVGRNIYVREGCYACHSQMIRTFRDEAERYGHYSLAAESMYDHPFQWGSKRTGPDLARVGGRYSDDWHVEHLTLPQRVVPESVMPPYAFLKTREVDATTIAAHLRANRVAGVPYSAAQIANAGADLLAQASPDADSSGLHARYAKVQVRDFDGDPGRVTEMDALVAYLQMLGTLVDFDSYVPADNRR